MALAATAALPLGILKGATVSSALAVTGLCVALLPQAIGELRREPRPRLGPTARWLLVLALVFATMLLLGEAG